MTDSEKKMEDLNLPGGIPVDSEYGGFEVLEDEDVADSAYSQASSIHNFRVEHGRRYHEYKEGHPFPYDEVSKENEASLHHLILLLLGDRYFLSPIDESRLRCIADVGTGSGFWAEGVAQRYPDAEVIGFDTIHHPLSIEPNCSFIIQDVTDDWVLNHPDMLFDLVHIRNLFVGVKDWKPVYQQCFEKMRSGGWIEQYEMEIDARTDDPDEPTDTEIVKLSRIAEDMAKATGRDFKISTKMKHLIEEAGFVDVQEQKVKMPLGPWASDPKLKDIGRFFERFYKTGLQGWLMHICTRFLGKKPEEVNSWCAKAFQEINSRQYRYYFPL
ncbi:putative SAM dependent methyltransferase [Cladophialophora carrionii]|uniref:Putative SAM dependent methyltransferase n=1 Tax=Cladophialophora carrionii TaxID=86049 RepID=A0A1C1CNF5_9EURO|nr:putative SAM dependent methyltransferase [Cladophialophora carrionii]